MPTTRARTWHGRETTIAWILAGLSALMLPAFAIAEPEWLNRDYLLDRWTNADGLPVNGTTDVHLGERGYLWLTTFDGLVRFDGETFEIFNGSGLPGNRLTGLIEQGTDQFWVLTEEYALASFDGRRFHTATVEQGLPVDRVLKLHLDQARRLWVGTSQGLALACGPRCFQVIEGGGIEYQGIQAFAESSEGQIWVGTDAGHVARVTPDGVQEVRDLEATVGLGAVWAMVVDDDGVLFAGGKGSLARIEGSAARRVERLDGTVVTDLEVAPGGDVIVQTLRNTYRRGDDGWRVDNEGPMSGHIRLVAAGPQGSVWRARQTELLRDGVPVVRASCAIRDFEFDSTGGMWLATLCDGLWRIRKRPFETITSAQGLPEGPVYGLVEDNKGNLWASAAGGVIVRIRDQQVQQRYRSALPGHVLGTVVLDRDGRVWVGGGGVCMMSGSECRTPHDLPEALQGVLARTIFEDREGDLWVGGPGGIWRRRNGQWRDMRSALDLPNWVQVQVMAEADDGSLWFGTDSSGLRRRSVAGEVAAFGSDHGLRSNRIRDLWIDELGRLWVATADRGLCRSGQPVSDPGLSFDCLGQREGMYSDSLHRLLPDDFGRLWFNSNSGVFRVDRQAIEEVLDGSSPRVYPRVYTERDGLPDREGNGGVQNAGTRLHDGRLAFPGQGGIAVFDPAKVRPLPGAPKVVLEEIRLPGNSTLAVSDSVSLPLGERVFSVRFAGIKPGLIGPTYFRYRMDGGPWLEIGNDRSLSFDDVRPGDHELEIAAIDADSGVAGPVTRMRIAVPPFLLERASVRAGLVALLVTLIAAWLWRRRRASIRLQQYLNREVERRTAEAVRQHRIAERALGESDRNGIEMDRSALGVATRGDKKDSLADEVRNWVANNIHDGDVSIARLSEALFMSRSKLHRRLVEETGRSPGEFIRDVRLGIARQLLQDGESSVSDAAYAVGFSSVSGFSRAYRGHFGESPSETSG